MAPRRVKFEVDHVLPDSERMLILASKSEAEDAMRDALPAREIVKRRTVGIGLLPFVQRATMFAMLKGCTNSNVGFFADRYDRITAAMQANKIPQLCISDSAHWLLYRFVGNDADRDRSDMVAFVDAVAHAWKEVKFPSHAAALKVSLWTPPGMQERDIVLCLTVHDEAMTTIVLRTFRDRKVSTRFFSKNMVLVGFLGNLVSSDTLECIPVVNGCLWPHPLFGVRQEDTPAAPRDPQRAMPSEVVRLQQPFFTNAIFTEGLSGNSFFPSLKSHCVTAFCENMLFSHSEQKRKVDGDMIEGSLEDDVLRFTRVVMDYNNAKRRRLGGE